VQASDRTRLELAQTREQLRIIDLRIEASGAMTRADAEEKIWTLLHLNAVYGWLREDLALNRPEPVARFLREEKKAKAAARKLAKAKKTAARPRA
jgi:hypothetical protein